MMNFSIFQGIFGGIFVNSHFTVCTTRTYPAPPETNRNAFPKEKKQTKKEQQEKCA